MRNRHLGLLAAATALIAPLSACTDNSASTSDGASSSGEISVVSTADKCTVSAGEAPSGNLVFTVENKGSEVTEFYLLGADGVRVVGEVENIGPGLTRDLVVKASPGDYKTVCKPGMKGDGIQAAFTVTEGEEVVLGADEAELVATATEQYKLYVGAEVQTLVDKTAEFAKLYIDGKDDEARALYAPARVHWERIEPVAESFGDLDPRLDLREADLEEGQAWTGWHAIEKDLWPPASGFVARTSAQRKALADQLVADTEDLASRVKDLKFTPHQLGNGAKELLDEMATGKITGEEDRYSHTDLADFAANWEGSKKGVDVLRTVLDSKKADFLADYDRAAATLDGLIAEQKQGDGYARYDTVSTADIQALSDALTAVSEQVGKIGAALAQQ